jgi:hypothetical protein
MFWTGKLRARWLTVWGVCAVLVCEAEGFGHGGQAPTANPPQQKPGSQPRPGRPAGTPGEVPPDPGMTTGGGGGGLSAPEFQGLAKLIYAVLDFRANGLSDSGETGGRIADAYATGLTNEGILRVVRVAMSLDPRSSG